MPKLEYAGFWIRLLAVIIDFIAIIVPVGVVEFILSYFGFQSVAYLISLFVVGFFIWIEGKLGGTPGKLLLGLRVVNNKGKYIGIPNAIFRRIGKLASQITLGIGYLMIAWDPKKQGLHDRIAKTYVAYQKSLK